ncbi:MAG: sensor histidine kinase [Chloroflexota bacterium]|nr:sensor histidine kinase [Chloroflexota bacterium]
MRDPQKVSPSGSRSPYLLWLVWIIWLPFFVPPIGSLILAHPPLPRLMFLLMGVALFVGLYLWATWRNAQRLSGISSSPGRTGASSWLLIAGFLALSAVLALLVHGMSRGSELLEPFIFTTAYVAGRLPTVRAGQVVLALTLLTAAGSWLLGLSWLVFMPGIVYIAVVGAVVISITRLVTTGQELRAAREEIARLAVMTERLRIARDLHDLLGHNLSLIALKSELARRLMAVAPERAAVEIGDVEKVARTTLQEVREAVGSYRQPTLASQLHGAQEILAAAGMGYRYEGDESIMDTLPTAIEAILAWTVREGVTNVIRHSHAHQCTICVARARQDVCVEVIDDGAGSVPLSALQPNAAAGSGGNGLRGLAERVAALGGHCEAGPGADGGFRLAVSVPLVQRNHAVEMTRTGVTPPAPRGQVAPAGRSDSAGERDGQP